MTIEQMKAKVEELAKRANQRLRQLEKSGIGESSRAYQVTARNVYDHKKGYTVTKQGNIAFERSTKGKSGAELEAQIERLENFLDASTGTVRGYKGAFRRSYEGFLESTGTDPSEMSFEEYQELFSSNITKTYGYGYVQGVAAGTGQSIKSTLKAMEKVIREQANEKKVLGQKNMIARITAMNKKRKK